MIKLKKLLTEWNDTSFKKLPKRWSKPVMKGENTDGLTEFERISVEIGKLYTDKDRPAFKTPSQIEEEQLNEMDYQKLIPIQISNIIGILYDLKQANALGKTKQVQQRYMQAYKLFKSVKKSINNL